MNTKLFSEAMNEIDGKYYEEAAKYQRKKYGWIKFASAAACAAVIAAVSLTSLWPQIPRQAMPQPEINHPAGTTPNRNVDDSAQEIKVNINEISIPDVRMSALFCLSADDYISMTYEELLNYFDVSLPITEILPDFSLQNEGFGIFQGKDRNIYFDCNDIAFENQDKTQYIHIGLAKASKHMYDFFNLTGNELQFTKINGRELAVFHYIDESGQDCYYTEFLQNDVAFIVSAENTPVEDYMKCMQALVEKTPQSTEHTHSIIGRITLIDPYPNYIGISDVTGSSCGYAIELPDEISVDDYSLDEFVKITFTGEPATICTVWSEQLISIERINE